MAIGSLAVRVRSDTTQFNRGMAGASRRARTFGGEARDVAKKAALMTGAITAATAGIAALTTKSIQSTKEMANLAQMANTSTSNFQKMAFGARTVGIEQEKLADILKDVNDRVGDFMATGAGPMADFFEKVAPKVGVTAEQFERLSGPDALQLFVTSLERANVSQKEMTFFMEAMASDATRLLPLLRNGGEQMGIYADQATRLGIALSDVDAEQVRQAGIAIDGMTTLFGGFVDQFTAEVAPVLVAFSKMLNQNAEDAGGVGEVAAESFNAIVEGIAFVVNAWDVFGRMFSQSGSLIQQFGLAFKVGLLEIAREIVEIPTAAVNEMLMVLRKIPGLGDIDLLGMSDFGKKIQREIKSTNVGIKVLQRDLHEELSQTLPGDQFKRFVFEAQEAGEKSAQAMLKARREMDEALQKARDQQGETGNEGTDFSLTANDIAKREEEARKRRLEKIQDAFEQEFMLTEEFNLRMAELRDLKEDADLVSETEFQQARLEKMRSFFSEQYGIASSGYDALGNLAASHWNAETAMAVDALGNIVNTFAGESRKMFEIQKAAGIANAIVSTYTGMSKALELGWPLGPIAAASIAANGFANVAAIKSQSFNGGGSGAGGGGGSSATQGASAQQEQVQSATRNVNVDLGITGGDSRDRAVAGSIVNQINDEIERGGRINRIGVV